MFTGMILQKSVVLFGLGSWLLLGATNNLTDPKTNRHLIFEVASMGKLVEDPTLIGRALLWRAWKSTRVVAILLGCIAVFQLLIALLLMVSAALMLYSAICDPNMAGWGLVLANIALSFFCALWFFFLCGGLWFLYWVKFINAQTTHFILLMLGIASSILINLPA